MPTEERQQGNVQSTASELADKVILVMEEHACVCIGVTLSAASLSLAVWSLLNSLS